MRWPREGISAEVIDVATLKPLDFDTILESVAKTGRCVIVHEAPRTGGFGAEIAADLAEHGLLTLLAPVQRVTGYGCSRAAVAAGTPIPARQERRFSLPCARRWSSLNSTHLNLSSRR